MKVTLRKGTLGLCSLKQQTGFKCVNVIHSVMLIHTQILKVRGQYRYPDLCECESMFSELSNVCAALCLRISTVYT